MADGLARLDSEPHCIILDLNLPDGSGATILERVRAERVQTLVVVATAEGDPGQIAEVARLMPDLFVQKPLDWEIVWRYCDTEARRSDASETGV